MSAWSGRSTSPSSACPGALEQGGPGRASPRVLFTDKEGQAARQLDPYMAPWYIMYLKPGCGVENEGGLLYDNFRRLFRVPVEMFHKILQDAESSGLWTGPAHGLHRPGQRPKPLSLKILCALRVLALGCDPSAVWEASACSRQVIQKFMHGVTYGEETSDGFIAWFVKQYGHYIDGYKDSAEMENAAAVFNGLGLPGCISSKLLQLCAKPFLFICSLPIRHC